MRTTSRRLNLRLLLGALLLVLFVCCSSLVLANSPEVTSQPEPTITVPLSTWNELKENSKEASSLIESSSKSLNEANLSMSKQAVELNELRTINEERSKELTELKAINEKQGQELARASTLLTEQENSLNETSNSLMELKDELKKSRATEQRLRRQRNTWSYLTGITVIAAAIK